MHDNQLEERLRQVLRTEGDSLRLTVTPAELRRHQALRERERSSRRVILRAAAAIALLAFAVSTALLFNRGDAPSVGTSPSPSASANSTATPLAASLAPVADIAPYTGYQTLGRANGPDDQLVVTIVGALAEPGDLMLVSSACTGIEILQSQGARTTAGTSIARRCRRRRSG